MEVLFSHILFIVGIIIVVKGGDIFIDAASYMSSAAKIPKFIIGATVVSLATTMPELFVSILATARGSNELAIGNATGSVTSNIGLIMGVSAVFMPQKVHIKSFWKKGVLMLFSALMLFFFLLDGHLAFFECILLFLILLVFIYININSIKENHGEIFDTNIDVNKKNIIVNIFKFILGAAFIILGAKILVDNGVIIAKTYNVPQSVIGICIVAVGTSLPELITTIAAIAKKESALSIGNILGANIIDTCLILPICSLITKGSLKAPYNTIYRDIPVTILLMAVAVLPGIFGKKLYRLQGFLLIAIYISYVLYISIK